MKFSYNKLKGRIVEIFGSRKAFAAELGVPAAHVSRKVNGYTGFSQTDIIKWSELLDIDESEYSIYFFA